MAMIKEEVIQELRTREEIFFVSAAATNHPFVVCDEESFNDQVWLFSTEDGIKGYFETLKEKKIPLLGKKLEKKNLGNFYYQLRMIGVNAVVWNDGEESMELELDEVAPLPQLSEEDQKKIPPMNPSLQLSGIYFMQEMRRAISMEEHQANGMRDLEEELLVNVVKSTFYMLLRQDPNDETKMGPLFIKNKEEKLYQPFFSDTMEMSRFIGKNQGLRVVRVPFAKLKELVPQQAEGIIINPGGFNLALKRDQVLKLIG